MPDRRAVRRVLPRKLILLVATMVFGREAL